MSDQWEKTNVPGVYAKQRLAVEWDEFGKGLAGESSNVQVVFLTEFIDAVHELGALEGSMQLQYIVDSLRWEFEPWEPEERDEARRRMRWFLRGLLEGLTEDPDDN